MVFIWGNIWFVMVLLNMKKENITKALELFQYGYEDSVIAARSELPIGVVKDLRKAWNK